MGSARAAPNFSGSWARVSGSGWGAGGSLPLAPARAAPMSLRGMGRRPVPCRGDNELRPQLGESGALLETPARMGGQSASENAKAAAGAGTGARWRCLRGVLVFGGWWPRCGYRSSAGAGGEVPRSEQRPAGPRRRGGSRPAPPLRSRGTRRLGHAGSPSSRIFGEVVKSSPPRIVCQRCPSAVSHGDGCRGASGFGVSYPLLVRLVVLVV